MTDKQMKPKEKDFRREHWRAGNMVYPVPAVMVTCQRPGEKPNIITVAWTGTICSDPAMVYISVRPQRYSYDIIRETGEFVINLTTEKLAAAADFCGVRSGRDLDKFAERGLTPIPSRTVLPPAIGESPVAVECRVKQIIPLGTHDMFIAEVLSVSVDSSYVDENGRLDLKKTAPLAYCHGAYFGLGKFMGQFGFSVRKKKPSGKRRGKEKR